jgi:hypothetical protein
MTSSVGHDQIKTNLNQLLKAQKVPNSIIFSDRPALANLKSPRIVPSLNLPDAQHHFKRH